MASRAKDSGVKDKRGKSPSNLRHTTGDHSQRRTSPHPPPAANSTNVPNYLRPTASSRSDTSKSPTAKKPSLNITVENTAQKANINRRRSLDNKPPSTSQLSKSQPTSSDKSPNKPNPTLHSPTSYIVKPKPLPGKDSKALGKDAGKSTTTSSRPGKTVKKNITNSTVGSSTTTKKQKSAGRNASTTKPRHTIDREAKQEPVQEDGDHKSLVAESEDEEKGTNQVEDKDHLDDAQHNEGEGDHQSEDTEESDEEMKKLPDPLMVYARQKTTTPVSEGPNKVAIATEKEDNEAGELQIDGPQIEDKVEEDDEQKNTHENHHRHQQKESFESESMDDIDNVERLKLEETEEYPKQNMLEKEEVNDEENTENKSEHDTQEDKVESEDKKEKTIVKGDEAEVNIAQLEVKKEKAEVEDENTNVRSGNVEVQVQKAYIEEQEPDVKEEQVEVTDQRPDIEVRKTDVKEEETKVKDQRVDIEELKRNVKEEEQGVEEEKSEVKEENPEVKEEESEDMENNKLEESEKRAKAKEEKQVNEGVKEEKSEVMKKKMVWGTTSGQLGNNKDNKSNSNAYNNVIEETASKLKEQRKNKVLALVGAFETVISLEDPDSETPRGN